MSCPGDTGCVPGGGSVRGVGHVVCPRSGLGGHLLPARSCLPLLQDLHQGQEDTVASPHTEHLHTIFNTYSLMHADLGNYTTQDIFFIPTAHTVPATLVSYIKPVLFISL